MTRGLLVVVVFLAFAGTARADTLKVGSLTLRSCGSAYCGKLSRPLDPAKPTGRRIDIAFRWYRAPKRPTGPPIVAVEGGPGYPSTGTRVEYRGIFGPLVRTRGMLLVDNRGTGGSALIDCKSVQCHTGRTSGSAFARRAGRCGRFIEREFGRGASALFSTAYAVDDLAAIVRALRLNPIDLYGDSYGTFFVQDFIARHPGVLQPGRAGLELSAQRRPTPGTRPRGGVPAALETGLARSRWRGWASCWPACGRRRSPARPRTPTAARCRCASTRARSRTSCRPRPRTRSTLRELDASIAAALAGDDVPLLRLTGQAGHVELLPQRRRLLLARRVPGGQLHRPAAALRHERDARQRRAQLAAAVAPDGAFAPFTGAEWSTISGFSQPYDVCLDWPKPFKRPPRLPQVKLPAGVPILIIGGDLDSLTPLLDAPVVRAEAGRGRDDRAAAQHGPRDVAGR